MNHHLTIRFRIQSIRVLIVFSIFVVLLFSNLGHAFAQEQSPEESPRPSSESSQALTELIQRIERNSKKLNGEISQEQENERPGQTRPGEPTGSIDHQRSISEIREQLKLLRNIRPSKGTGQQPTEKLPLTPGTSPPSTDRGQPLRTNQAMQMNSPPPDAMTNPPNPGDQSISATRIIPEPVNTLEMGNSIFMTGNYPAALEAFDKVDESKITAGDTMWLHAMKAACHRRLKDTAAANGFYREIANAKVDGVSIKKNASFWLEYNEAKARNMELFESIDQNLSLLVERANERIKASR